VFKQSTASLSQGLSLKTCYLSVQPGGGGGGPADHAEAKEMDCTNSSRDGGVQATPAAVTGDPATTLPRARWQPPPAPTKSLDEGEKSR
jgi:hypothetical protein